MDFSGEYDIPAPPSKVWEALNDPAVLQRCIPGCRDFEKRSDTEFVATVAAKVGPVSATFKGAVTLSDLDPPNGYTIAGQGQGGTAGFAKGSARVTLEPKDGGTLLRYQAKVDIGGKLASVGSRLVQGVAKKNADDFFSAFVAQVAQPAAEEPAAAPAAAPTTQPAPAGTLRPWIVAGAALAAVAAVAALLLAGG